MSLLSGKTILVTGATDGIGKETALELAAMGATVILHGRSAESVQTARDEIRRAVPGAEIKAVQADFSSLRQVRDMAARIQTECPLLDVLINNAGVFMKKRALSEDGYEMTFAVNHLAHFLLTSLLLDLLKRSGPARVVTVSSMVHTNAKMDFLNLQAEHHFDPHGSYALSKLANVLFARELSERLRESGITSNSLHPGVINTKMLRAAFHVSGASVKDGAATSVYLASSREVERVTGKYFVQRRASPPSPLAGDADLRLELWHISEALAGA